MAASTVLDHVALAAESAHDLWPRYVGELAGHWEGGGDSIGFSSAQVRYASGMKVEALSPFRVADNDFLRRFLDASGPGPHHLTFKVADLRAHLERARSTGFEPINIDLSDPGWLEAFLHPKAACGIVVQLAQSSGDYEPDPPPNDLPRPQRATADLSYVAHLVADLAVARRLFEGLLDGELVGGAEVAADLGGVDGVALRWASGGRLHLVEPSPGTDAAAWLGARAGRLHHLAFTVERPHDAYGAEPMADGRFVVQPERNHGTRLVLSAP